MANAKTFFTVCFLTLITAWSPDLPVNQMKTTHIPAQRFLQFYNWHFALRLAYGAVYSAKPSTASVAIKWYVGKQEN